MKRLLVVSLVLIALFALVSCQQEPEVPQVVEKTPTIRGSVSIPDGSDLSGSDFYIRVMEGEKAVYTGRVNADGSFSVSGLSEEASYSILVTTEEPGDIKGSEKDISRATKTSGYGGWLSNVTASINEQAGVGSIKVKPLGTIKGVVKKDGAEDNYDTTVYIPGTSYLAMTDGEGNYSLFNVPQATYTLRYISNGYMAKMVENVVLYSESDTENPVTTVQRQTLIKNAGNLIGIITKDGCEDHSDISVMLSDGINTYTGSTSTDGSLQVTGILPGTYTVTISSSGFVTQTRDNVIIEAAKNTSLYPISLTANGGTITGSVIMNDGGDRVGVVITAKTADRKYSYTTSSDTDGKFTLMNVYPGEYTLTLSQTGYAIRTKTGVKILAGQSTSAGLFVFSSDYGTVSGTVKDTKGNAIENAIVKVGEISIFTGANGQFSKTGIPVGNHTVSISKEGYATQTLGQTITVESNKTVSIGTIQLASIYGSLSGRVTLNDGGSANGISVTATASDGSAVQARTLSDGSYSITDLNPGTYRITAEAEGYAIASRNASVVANRVTTVDVLTLTNRFGTISGTVKDTKGNAIENAIVKVGEISVFTDGNGQFSKTGIPVGNHTVTISKEGYNTQTLGQTITVESSKTVNIGTIRLSAIYGSISGTVSVNDGKSAASIDVTATDSNGAKTQVKTLSNGTYSITNLSAGTYTVTANADGYASATRTAAVTADSNTSVDVLALASLTGSLKVTVGYSDKNATSGITVTVNDSAGTKVAESTTTNSLTVSFTGIPVGTYTVTAEAESYAISTKTGVTVHSAAQTQITVPNLTNRFGTVSGTVKDTKGNAIENAIVKVGEISVFTGANGTFTKSGIAVGNYNVTVSKDGYTARTLSDKITVEASKTTSIGTINLASIYGSITGSVTVNDNGSVANIDVTATTSDGTKTQVKTLSNGTYTIANLLPGTYSITAESDGYIVATRSVAVTADSITTVDDLALTSIYGSIEATVSYADSSEKSGITVTLYDSDAQVLYETTTIDSLSVRFTDVPVGTGYRLVAEAVGYGSRAKTDIIVSSATETKVEVQALSNNCGQVNGLVTDTKGNPIANAIVRIGDITVFTDSTGRFSKSGITVGSYTVKVSKDGYSEKTLSDRITVESSRTTDIGTITLASIYGAITGTVSVNDNGSAANIDVTATDSNGAKTQVKTLSNGTYSITNLSAGTYTVTASADGYASVSRTAAVTADANTSIDVLALTSLTGSLRVTTGYSDKNVTSGITVTVNDSTGAKVAEAVTTDSLTVSFTSIPVGTYTVTAEAENYATSTKAGISVQSAVQTQVTVPNLTNRYGTVSGTVKDTKGNAIENTIVKIGDISVFTEADGTFSKTGIPVGNHSVSISKEGYTTQALAQTITVEASKTTSIGTISLASLYGSLSGTVSVNDNGSVANIDVTATASDGSKTQVKTLSNGTYSITNLPSGTYTVTANADGYASATRTVAVTADSVTEVDELALTSLYGSIEVTVSYSDSDETSGITVTLYNSEDQKLYETITTNSLTVSFNGIPVGTDYRIVSEATGYGARAKAEINVASAGTTLITVPGLSNNCGMVNGRVTDTNGNALENAIVKIGDVSVFTGSDGRFSKSNIEVGNYTVTVSKDGYTSKTLSDRITIESSRETAIGTVLLASEYGKLTGSVTVNDGNGTANINISAISSNGNYSYSTLTDENGNYVITGVQPGNYTVTAKQNGYTDATTNVDVIADRTATALTIGLGATTGSLKVTVGYSDKNVTSGITVTVNDSTGAKVTEATTTNSLTVSFTGIPVGTYTVTAEAESYATSTKSGVTITSASETQVTVPNLTNRFGTVSGTVKDTKGNAIENAIVKIGEISVLTDANGAFTKTGIPVGNHIVSISKEGYTTQTLAQTITVEASTTTSVGTINLASIYGSITGTVSVNDNGSVSSIDVTATDSNGTKTQVKTLSNGTYTIANLLPGTYTITAESDGYSSATRTVAVTADSNTSVDVLALTSLTGRMKITVGYSDKNATAGITVTVNDSTGAKVTEAVTTDSLTISFTGIPVGTYTVTAEAENYATSTKNGVTITSAAETQATVPNLTNRFGTVSGTVKDTKGNAIENAIVKIGEISVLTDANGTFTKTGIPVGNHSVVISKDGYSTQTLAQTITVEASTTTSIGTISLASIYGTITGTVSVNDNGSVANIDVTATDFNGAKTQVKTLSDGTYSIENLNPGTYTISANADGYSSASRSVAVTADSNTEVDTLALSSQFGRLTVSAYYYGNPDPSGITISVIDSMGRKIAEATTSGGMAVSFASIPVDTYTLTAEAEEYATSVKTDVTVISAMEISVTLPGLTNRYGTVSGTVKDTRGNVIENAIVKIGEISVLTGTNGTFTKTGIPVGNHSVLISKDGYTTQTLAQTITVEASTTTSIGTISLASIYGSISGAVSVNDNGTAANIDVTATASNGAKTQVKTLSDGTYTIPSLLPGTYTVSASADGYSSVTRTAAVTADTNTTVDELALTSLYGSIEATVGYSDSDGTSGITVTLYNSEDQKLYETTTTDSLAVKFNGIAVGTGYRVVAEAVGYGSRAKTDIIVSSATETKVEVQALSNNCGQVNGLVTDTKGNPIANAIVRIGDITVFTGSDGRFSKSGITVGSYSVKVSKDDYSDKTLSDRITVESSRTTDIGTVQLSSVYGGLWGVVTVNDGGTVEGITVSVAMANGSSVQARTLPDGSYEVGGLDPGTYTVTAESSSYATATKTAVVNADRYTEVDDLALTSLTGRMKITVSYSDKNATAGITVTVNDSTGAKVTEAVTTDSLTISFTGIPVGTYTVTAEADGYAASVKAGVSVMSALETSVSMSALTNRYGTVSGKVTDTDGAAIENAIVKVGEISVLTGEDGRFSKTGISVGNYSVTVSKDGYETKTLTDRITVEASNTTEIGTILLSSVYGKLTGSVRVDDGKSLNGIGITAVSSNGNYSYSTLTDEYGNYVITSVQPGTYTVTAKQSGYTDTTASVDVIADRTAVAGTMNLASVYGSISGKVALADSADNSGVTVTLTFIADTTIAPTTVSGADGTYAFSNLTNAGQYSVTFSKDGYVSSTGTVVTVTLGQNQTIDDVTLRSLASKVSGTATLAETQDYTGISVLLKATDNSVQYDATTDQQGSYVMARVKPGEYTLTVSKAGYVSKTVEDIIVESSTEKTLDAVSLLVGSRSITGTVTAELKTDHSGSLITATNLSDQTKVYSAISNSVGAYTLAGMVPGEYSVVISHTGYRTLTLPTVNVLEGTTKTLDAVEIEINRGTISGVATLEGRISSEGIRVELLQGNETVETKNTNSAGEYSFYVPQGNYSGIRMTMTDFRTETVSESIALFADNYISIDNTELKAIANSVYGTADVLTTDDDSAVTVSFDGHSEITAIVTEADGVFRFDHIPLGNYTLRFQRENCSDIIVPINVIASDGIDLNTVTVTPNTATIKGKVNLENGSSLSGVLVSVDMGTKTATGYTDASGRYEIGGISVADVYTVTYSKDGWQSDTQQISPKLERLEIREMEELTLVDTTAPVLNSVVINSGANTAADRNVTLHFTTTETGSGVSKVMITYDNVFDRTVTRHDYLSNMEWELPSGNGEKTIYVKVVDAAGNESNTATARVTLTDQKKEVSGVLTGDDLHWTEELSPYLVTGNILVEEGKSLVIDPGVDVQFAGAFYIQVEGTITAIGTEEKNISFFGINDGENSWQGIRVAEENGSIIKYSSITNPDVGLCGYLDVAFSQINAGESTGGYALGGYYYVFAGKLYNCQVNGRVVAVESSFNKNMISSSSAVISESIVQDNQLDITELSLSKCLLINEQLSGGSVYMSNTNIRNASFDACNVLISGGTVFNCAFSDCEFLSNATVKWVNLLNGNTVLNTRVQYNGTQKFSPYIIHNSNLINCSIITLYTPRTTYSEFDYSSNFWGYDKTRELEDNGTECNLSFITDYYDDFYYTKAIITDYKTEPIEGAGFLSSAFYPNSEESVIEYAIGDVGPAGGYVFYDKGYYSEGWRYLEAAPSDLEDCIFGYYRIGDECLVIGTINVVGAGYYNTQISVEAMGLSAYKSYSENAPTTAEYATRLCAEYEINGYSDWFMPSKNELVLMYENLRKSNLGGFSNRLYLSSSEWNNMRIMCKFFDSYANTTDVSKDNYGVVRPIRAF